MRVDRDFFGQMVLTLLGFAFLVWIIILCASCKTQKQTYQYDGSDYTQHTDSAMTSSHTEGELAKTQTDSASVTGTIVFADGGGHLIVGGIEMDGVQQIDGSLLSGIKYIEVERIVHDTISVAVTDTIHHTEVSWVENEVKTKPLWWLYLVCFALGAGVIVALKKIPYTKPLMFWL